MLHTSLAGLDKKTLRLWLLVFFLALAIPTAILVRQAYSELKWETFHQYRLQAEELAVRIDRRFGKLIDYEEAHAFADYTFLNVAGDPSANFLQRSPLSVYPVESAVPGMIGYFQVDTRGAFSTPLLPPSWEESAVYGISTREREQRLALQERIRQILSVNRLVQGGEVDRVVGKSALTDEPMRHDIQTGIGTSLSGADEYAASAPLKKMEEGVKPQAAFDRLNTARAVQEQEKKQKAVSKLGRIEDLKLDYRYQAESADKIQQRVVPGSVPVPEKRARKERSVLPEATLVSPSEGAEADALSSPGTRIITFESEVDPFEFSLLDSGHFVLFRKVWRDGQRYIQGALIEQQPFLQGMIQSAFRETALSQMSDLIVAYRGEVFSAFRGQASRDYLSSAEELTGAVLLQARLSAPLSELELLFSIRRLPSGPGSAVINWLAGILLVVLCGGFYLMYRLGAGQIELARQQQDFVSAVSHELKTPLTSIRMYGEMLREGWASEDKKKTYYDFIYDESERLSRLISNVLQLARLTRNRVQAELKPVPVSELMDGVRSKISSQVERAGFKLDLDCDEKSARVLVKVDSDFFSQVMINLVDNAVKFAAGADRKDIDVACRVLADGTMQFSVRDYGPGIVRDQMKKIFKLFYRSENELTRETVGTGIGLALVQQLVAAMNGKVDVVNSAPGAEFRVSFPVCGS